MPERHTSGRGAWDYDRRADFVKPNNSGARRPAAKENESSEKAVAEQSFAADFAAEDFKARWWPVKDSPRRGS